MYIVYHIQYIHLECRVFLNIWSFCEHGIPAVPCFVCDDLAKLRSILVQASAKHVRRVVVVTVAVVTSVINQGCGKRRSNRRTNQRTAKNAMRGFGSSRHSISLYGFANVPNLSKSGKPRSILFLRFRFCSQHFSLWHFSLSIRKEYVSHVH